MNEYLGTLTLAQIDFTAIAHAVLLPGHLLLCVAQRSFHPELGHQSPSSQLGDGLGGRMLSLRNLSKARPLDRILAVFNHFGVC